MPPFKMRFVAALEEAPRLLLLPPLASELTDNVPALIVVAPVYVFLAPRVRVPAPFFINAPVPLMAPFSVTLPAPETVRAKPPFVKVPDNVRVPASDAMVEAEPRVML